MCLCRYLLSLMHSANYMKRLVLILSSVCLLILISVYLIIPSKLYLSKTIHIETSEANARKFITTKKEWNGWWPGSSQKKPVNAHSNNKPFKYGGYEYHIKKITYSAVELDLKKNESTVNSMMVFSSISNYSIKIVWHLEMKTSFNPVKRIVQYQRAKIMRQNMAGILQHLKGFLEDEKNTYGIDIKLSKVKDSLLATTSFTSSKFPATAVVYDRITHLKKYIKKNGAKETNYPMLNISKPEGRDYEVMVAIPVNEVVKSDADISINRMVLGNILVTQVKGGRSTITKAFDQLKNFANDNRFISPAMPFESIITNRITEPDSSKWVTKIYYPIF